MKKIVSLLIAAITSVNVFCTSIPICAENYTDTAANKEDILRYSYTSSATSKLSISSSTATCKSELEGYFSVTAIAGTQYLQKKNGNTWSTVSGGTWSNSSNSNSISMSNSKSNLSSGTYRLKTIFTVFSGTKYETVEKISLEVMV